MRKRRKMNTIINHHLMMKSEQLPNYIRSIYKYFSFLSSLVSSSPKTCIIKIPLWISSYSFERFEMFHTFHFVISNHTIDSLWFFFFLISAHLEIDNNETEISSFSMEILQIKRHEYSVFLLWLASSSSK